MGNTLPCITVTISATAEVCPQHVRLQDLLELRGGGRLFGVASILPPTRSTSGPHNLNSVGLAKVVRFNWRHRHNSETYKSNFKDKLLYKHFRWAPQHFMVCELPMPPEAVVIYLAFA